MTDKTAKQILADHAARDDGGKCLVWNELSDQEKMNLRGANLREADLSGADLRGANLRMADLRVADLRVAYLRWADLSGADLSEADLSGANLRMADLSEANLSGANLREADLSGANLRMADLSEANLSGAYLPLMFADLGNRSDGYFHHAFLVDGIIMIRAGCRYFALAKAREHWRNHDRGKECQLCLESLAKLDLAEAVAKMRGWELKK